MTFRSSIVAMLAVACCGSTLFAQTYRQQDTAIGGLAGAVIGGIIGHQNDETPEGALIGGAVGAIAGNLLGKAKDQDRRYQHYRYQQAQHNRYVRQSRAVTINDAIQMTRSGLSESVIINHIQTNGVAHHVGTQQIIALHDSGVSERVIDAMQRRGVSRSYASAPTPVVVETPPVRPTVVVQREYHHYNPRPTHVIHSAPRVRYHSYRRYPSRPHLHVHHW